MATVNTNWTSPASATLDKATGATIDETMTDAWSSDLYHLGGTAGYIGCRATMSGSQSISNTTVTTLALGAESLDSDPNGAMHDNSTNNSRVTARTTGVYHIHAYVDFAANATGSRLVQILWNNSSALFKDMRDAVSEGGQDTYVCLGGAYLLNAAEYVEIQVYQSSGGALNVTGASLSVVKA